jgi:hypothetical protein
MRALEQSATAVWSALQGDPRVALHGDPGVGFLYRPGELLVDESPDRRSDAVRAEVESLIARHGGVRRPARVEDGAPGDDPLQELSIARYDLPSTVDVPAVAWDLQVRFDAEELRDRSGVDVALDAPGFNWPEARAALRRGVVAQPVASPNHVLPSAQHWLFGPCGLPAVADPPADPSPDRLTVGQGVGIAILDSGWAPNPSLLLQGHRTGPDDLDLDIVKRSGLIRSASGGHGTFVAGVIRQAAPGATIVPIRTLDNGLTDDAQLASDLLLARDTVPGLRLVNLSLGGPTQNGWPPAATGIAITALQGAAPDDDVLVVAAAGNNHSSTRFHPAACWGADPDRFRNVVSVGALRTGSRAAGFSNFGPWVRASAPGVDITSSYAYGRLLTPSGPLDFAGGARWSGTSFAAPHVTGQLAAQMTAGTSAAQALAQLKGAGTTVTDLGVGIL